ncbi:MAG: DMT family transporter [Pseudomonadota bacterium]
MSGRAWVELILLSVLWGGSFFSIAIAQREIGPITVVLHRVLWAALLLWALAFWRGLTIPRAVGPWLVFLIMGLLNNVLPFTLMSWGQTKIETGLVSVFNATAAIFGVMVAAAFLRDEPLTLSRFGGVILGVTGVAVISGIEALFSFDPRSLGQLAVLGGAVSYAFASVWGKLWLRGYDPVVAAAGMLTGSCLIMLPLSIATEGVPSLDLSAETWGAIGYFAFLATAGAYLLYYRILAIAGAGNLMLCTLLIPSVAITLGAVYLGEMLDPKAYAGFGLIALGLIVIDGRLLRRKRPSMRL